MRTAADVGGGVYRAALAVFALALPSAVLAARPPLLPGDTPATVTVNERPFSDDTDHVVAFKRGKEVYVSLVDTKQMVDGTMKRVGNRYLINAFPGALDAHRYIFTVGSAKAIAHGQPVTLHAPVVDAYGHVYIPMSFFEADALVTHVRYNGDHSQADIVIPGTSLF